MAASFNGHANVVRVLIEAHADINQQNKVLNKFLLTMLTYSSCMVKYMVLFIATHVSVLVETDTFFATQDGVTALFFSCQNRHQDVVQLLLQSGARDLPTKV